MKYPPPQGLGVVDPRTALKASAAALIAGQVLFPDVNGLIIQDSNLFWDNTNKRLGIGTGVPSTSLDIATGGARIRSLTPNKIFADSTGNLISSSGITVMTATHDVSLTGTQAITGAGFKPVYAVIFVNINNTSAMSLGFTDGVTIGDLFDNTKMVAGGANSYGVGGSLIDLLLSGTNEAFAAFVSFDADGITISWAKISTPTGTAQMLILFGR